jgi:hypothetical protein
MDNNKTSSLARGGKESAFYVGVSAPLLFDRAAAGIKSIHAPTLKDFDQAATGRPSGSSDGDQNNDR